MPARPEQWARGDRHRHRVAVLRAPETFVIEEHALPPVGEDQVRVRLEGCGVCGSSLPVWEGRPWFEYPQAPGSPGHEGWGTVIEPGRGVRHLAEGTPVALLSQHAYADQEVVDASLVIPLPAPLQGRPFPGEALGCAFNVMRRSAVAAGQSVAVLGAGFLGLLLVALAARAGARVVAVSRRENALEVARAMGAGHVLRADEPGAVVQAIMDWTSGRGCERVLEATGMPGPLAVAGDLAAVRGRLVIAGYHQDGLREVNMQVWNWRGLDVINAHERDPAAYLQGMREAAAAVEEGWLDPTPLFSHRFPLERINEAFAGMRDHRDGFVKALVCPSVLQAS